MVRTLFFRMVLRKFSEIFSQYNVFYNYEYYFFQSAFWSLFNHRQRSQLNQEPCSQCCSSPCFRVLLCTHCGPLKYFSTCFHKLKEIRVLWPIFSDYAISCDYGIRYNRITYSFIISLLQNRNRDANFWQSPTVYEESNFTLKFFLEKHLFDTDIFIARLRLETRGKALL